VRSLGRLKDSPESQAVLALLADRDWTVRDAAKQTLADTGTTVASVAPFLTHADRFARNSAAEVLQNVGEFERLLVLEAKGPSDPERLRTLQLLVHAGGTWMRDSVLERLSADIRPRAQQLLVSMELQHPFFPEAA
jgi:HEAT repeat protein